METQQIEAVVAKPATPPKKSRLSSITRRRIKRLVGIVKQERDITNEQLCKEFRLKISSVYRLKKLAVDYGYASRDEIMGVKFGEKTIQPMITPEVKPGTQQSSPETNVVLPVETVQPEINSRDIAVSTIMKKLASIMSHDFRHAELWNDIAAYAQLMVAQSRAAARAKGGN